MEEKQELNNILLDRENTNESGSKKYILIGAALVLLFLIVLAIMRALNSDNNTQQDMLPPEPTSKNIQKNEQLFEEVPIKDDNARDREFEQIVKDIREKTKANTQSKDEELSVNEKVVDIPQNTNIKPIVKTKEVTVSKPKPNKKLKSEAGYYIQVGAFYNLKPNKKLIAMIKAKGFEYTIYNTKVNGKNIVKVLVGPYLSKSAAKSDLPKVRKSIQKGAYLFNIK